MSHHPWNCSADGLTSVHAAETPSSEDDCLSLINELFPDATGHFPGKRDDDCAVLLFPHGRAALSTDYFWENVHFRASYFTPQEAGGKALAVSTSDLAAAGAVPLGFSLGLMLPKELPRRVLRDILSGMAEKAKEYGITLTGGDLSSSPDISYVVPADAAHMSSGTPQKGIQTSGVAAIGFCLTVWGQPAGEGVPFLSRGQALPGDCIFAVGQLGLAGVGLHMLEKYGRVALQDWPTACSAHLDPAVYLEEGRILALLAHEEILCEPRLGLMDCSDGLARDLPRLLRGLGAELSISQERMHPEILAAAPLMHAAPDELLLRGGEDYALLGTCSEAFWPRVKQAIPCAYLLGVATALPGISCNGTQYSQNKLMGFDHFQSVDTLKEK